MILLKGKQMLMQTNSLRILFRLKRLSPASCAKFSTGIEFLSTVQRPDFSAKMKNAFYSSVWHKIKWEQLDVALTSSRS